MNGRIGLIFNGVWSQYAMATAPKYSAIYRLLYVHDLAQEDLSDLDAIVIPFQSHQESLHRHQDLLYDFLRSGRKVAVFGDSTPLWLPAVWEDRPVNNYWWVKTPESPPISQTNFAHPIFQGLSARQACWHVHGIYSRIPESAEVLQTNENGEIISWQTCEYGGTLFVSTLDPIVEHGIQQIRHLDHFVDSLTFWLCGRRPTGRFSVLPERYGVSRFDGRPPAIVAGSLSDEL